MSSTLPTATASGKRKGSSAEQDDSERPSKQARHSSCPREPVQHQPSANHSPVSAAVSSNHETCASKRKREEDCEPEDLTRPCKQPHLEEKETEEKSSGNASPSQATPSEHVNSATTPSPTSPPPQLTSSHGKRVRAVSTQDEEFDDERATKKPRLMKDAESLTATSTAQDDTHKPSSDDKVVKEESSVRDASASACESKSDSQHQRASTSGDQEKPTDRKTSDIVDTVDTLQHQSSSCCDELPSESNDSRSSPRESFSGSSDSDTTNDTTITVPDSPEPNQESRTSKREATDAAASTDSTSQSRSELEINLPDVPDAKGLTGLLNCSNACYSNAVIQLLDGLFTATQIAKIRGAEDIADFGKDGAKVWNFSLANDPSWERKKAYKVLRANIESLPDSTRKSAFLGQLLIDLRTGLSKKARGRIEDFIPPLIFQHIFALCGVDAKPEYDGLTQQDSASYLDGLLKMLEKERCLDETAFAATIETTKICTDKACNGTFSETTQEVQVLVTATEASTSFQKLIQDWLDEIEDIGYKTCQKCDTRGHLVQHRYAKALPDSLIVQIQRQTYCRNKVSIPFDQTISLNQREYEVAAVICRDGDSPLSGHYKCFKKVDGTWYLCNDEKVEAIEDISKLGDGMRKYGRSTMVLLKHVLL